jgi:hypothetical protein
MGRKSPQPVRDPVNMGERKLKLKKHTTEEHIK